MLFLSYLYMKIAIISDTHFGFKENTELANDSYINFEQALDLAVKDNDIILMPGDLFDLEEPSQKTYDNLFKIISKYNGLQKIKNNTTKKTLTHIPIVIIAGTHEYKGKGYTSPIDVIESSNYFYQLKHSNIIFEKENEKVNICGMSGVPEKYAKEVLEKINFQKIDDAINIIMTHQSYNELLAFDDEMVSNLSIDDLPLGFDLYINGHLHKKQIIKSNKLFVIPGSTIITQIKKQEIKDPRGFMIFDTLTKEIVFKEIPLQRKYFYEEIKLENTNIEDIKKEINMKIEKIKNEFVEYNNLKLKPVLKIKINVKLNFGEKNISEKDFLQEDCILILDKQISLNELKTKIDNISFEKDKQTALEKSQEIFISNLNNSGFKKSFDPEELMSIQKDNDAEKTTKYILEKVKEKL